MQHALHHLCLVSESITLYFHCLCQSTAPLDCIPHLKQVLGRLGDIYQVYCNSYKTHAMATHHGGSGQPLDRVTCMPREEQLVVNTDVEVQQDFHPEDTDQFENFEHNSPARLHAVTRKLDDLHQRNSG